MMRKAVAALLVLPVVLAQGQEPAPVEDAPSYQRRMQEERAREEAKRKAAEARAEAEMQRAMRDAERTKKALQADWARRTNLPGPAIGMTPEQVVSGTSWGRPARVIRTVTKQGATEQWVYSSGNYLYFVDGKVDAIQSVR